MESCHIARHVKAHQDDYIRRASLLIEAQLNCIHDNMLKTAINNAVGHRSNKRDILLLEDVCVFVDGEKQTTDVIKGLRFSIGRQKAREFYAKGKHSGTTGF